MYINIKFRIVNTIEYSEYNNNYINFTFKIDICTFVYLNLKYSIYLKLDSLGRV